ncbi:MAG TPA: hypothetical protein VMH39_05040, partial [Gemmatimonadaceae bacterium]|nr:hypothetical protein [Gemmatimonadaceae bacterium]
VARHITPGTAFQFATMFHPDGDRVLYGELAEGVYRMSVVSIKTGKRTPLLPNETRPYSGVWSPDGSHIAYGLQDGAKSTVWVADSDGSHRRQLTTEGFEGLGSSLDGVWSPDGKEILYTSTRTGTSDLWVAPIDGSAPRQLTRDVRNDANGAWSSDGKWIAFISDRGRQLEVWVVPSAGGAERRITDDASEKTEMPRWRPGSHELAFISTTSSGAIWALDLADGAERRLTPDSIRTTVADVSADGNHVALVIDRGGNIKDLATMSTAGGAWRTLVSGGGTVWTPTWSPNAAQIAFSSDRGGTSDIWVVDSAGGAPRQVENWPGYESLPTWSGDGSRLYFTSDRESKFGDLWSVPAAGGDPVRVTHDAAVLDVAGRAAVSDVFVMTISQRAGDFNISRVAAGGTLQPIWDKTNAVLGPISPKGDSIVIDLIRPNGGFQAMMFSTHGGEGRPVLKALEYPEVWSRDGRFLIYSFVSSSRRNLAMLDRTDGSTHRFAPSPDDEDAMGITADGKTLIVRRGTSVSRMFTADLTSLLAGGP